MIKNIPVTAFDVSVKNPDGTFKHSETNLKNVENEDPND